MLRNCSKRLSTVLKSCSRAVVSLMMVSIIWWCLVIISSNSPLHFSFPPTAICAVAISLSVIPPNALTTTITGCRLASVSTMRFKHKMLFTEPTDVPPNFKTFICCYNLILCCPRTNEVEHNFDAKITINRYTTNKRPK